MRPEDNKISTTTRGNIQPPQRSHAPSQAAAANVARGQIDSIYNQQARTETGEQYDAVTTASSQSPQDQSSQPYNAYSRTHQPAHTVHASEWQKYHSAWQEYYQKYYEHYYHGAVSQVHQAYTKKASELQARASQPAADTTSASKDEAMYDLRSQLINNVKASSKKVRGSRHFIPLVAAMSVLLLFAGLQYNRVIVANVKAYVTPGEIDPQNIVVDPNASLSVGKEPRIIIPKINVNAPVVYDTTPDQASQLEAMEGGVSYFGIPGANSKPGQIGNTVLSGHSSNDFIDDGQYKFVFALLERLKKGDIFYLHYEGIRYSYTVSRTTVVKPTDVDALVYPTAKPEVTLITCTPLGTAQKRLLVTAEQISPSPTTAKPAPSGSGTADDEAAIPGNSPTILERIIGN